MANWTAPFIDGWWPKLSPDGKYLLCGDGNGRILDVASKATVALLPKTFMSSGWLNPTQCVCQGDLSGTDHQWHEYRLDAPSFTLPAELGPALNFNGAGGNVWAGGNTKQIWAGDQHGNAQLIAAGYTATVGIDGHIVYTVLGVPDTNSTLFVRHGGVIQRSFTPAAAPSRVVAGAQGYVGYGYSGPSWLNTPDNQNIEVGVTPDHVESPPLAFLHKGTVWLATTGDRGIYLRPLGVRDKAITITVPAINCDVVSMGDYFLVASQTDKGRLTISTIPADAALLPVEGPQVVVIGRPAYCGWFTFGTPHPVLPGNCELFVDADMLLRAHDGTIHAAYAAGKNESDLAQLNTAIAAQKHWGVPVLAYWTRGLWAGPLPTGADWLGVEAYTDIPNEDRALFEKRVRAQAARHPKPILIGDCRSNTNPTKDLTWQPEVYSRMIKDTPNHLGVIAFSGPTRKTGYQDHPEVHAPWTALAAGIPSIPKPEPVMQPPKGTIKSFGPPTSGLVPFTCPAVWEAAPDSGPIDKVEWLLDGQVVATYAASKKDHKFLINTVGAHHLDARFYGPGGPFNQTGKPRIVTGLPNTSPTPPPDGALVTGLLAHVKVHKYVTAENGGDAEGLLHAVERYNADGSVKQQKVDLWETHKILPTGSGKVNVQTSSGRFWHVDAGVVKANAVAAPEEFELIRNGDGSVTFKANDQYYVTCELDGRITATRTVAGEWERFALAAPGSTLPLPPKPPDPNAPGRKGHTTADGRHFQDLGGRFYPFGATLLWGLRGWKFENGRYIQNVQYAKRWCDFVRNMGEVDWPGNDFGPDWPDYQPQVDGLIKGNSANGVKTLMTCIGGRGTDINRVLDALIPVLQANVESLHAVEAVNEYYSLGYSEKQILDACNRLQTALPGVLVFPSNPDNVSPAPADVIKRWGFPMGSIHSERADGHPDGKWYMVRKPWDVGEPDRASENTEGPGPNSSVAVLDQPLHLACLRLFGMICGWESFILHNANGVQGTTDAVHHRTPNLWEFPGIDQIMDASKSCEQLIPSWCSEGARSRGGYDKNGAYAPVGPQPFQSDVFWPTNNASHGVVRDYCRTRPDGAEFVGLLGGIRDHVGITGKQKNWRVTLFDVITRQQGPEFDLNNGQSVTVPNSPSKDSEGLGAWVVRGVAR